MLHDSAGQLLDLGRRRREPIGDALGAPGDPEQAAGRLIDLANEAGGPDNIACVVAHVTEARS